MNTKRRVSKRRLQQYVEELIALAKAITPEVTTRLQIPGHDGQDAWLEIHVPEEVEEKIEELVIERVTDIFIKTGYDIGAIVYEISNSAEDSNALQA